MVKIEIWDDNQHCLSFSKVVKIEEVKRLLKRIRTEIKGMRRLWGLINCVQICTEDFHYNIFFTDNQFRKYKSTLEKLNEGEIPKKYVR